MEEKKFELGPLQKEWIASLRAHPERQERGFLGRGEPEKYNACCLGELLVCAHRILPNFPNPFYKGKICEINDQDIETYLDKSFHTFGLNSSSGSVYDGINGHTSLASANDFGMSWPEIADFIEAHPEKVFTKSV